MKELKKDITLESLIQYIEGTAGPEVRQNVENWLSSGKQHPLYFERIKEAWLNLDDLKSLTNKEVDKDWNKIARFIQKENKKYSVEWYRRSWLKIAAVFVLLMVSGLSFFLLRSPDIIRTERSVAFNEIVVPKGQKSHLLLCDGTKIWINAGSKIRFPNRFDGKIREVWLEGEGFFEVSKDPSRPFYVHTSDLNIKVLGTVFNVKAYADDGFIETTLVSGLVSIEKKQPSGTEQKILLEPNHKAIYVKSESTLVTEDIRKHVTEPLQPGKIVISQPVATEPAISWKDGKLIFEDEPFEDIAKKLERRYDVKIVIEDKALENYRYSGILKNISIEQAIKAIELTAPISYTLKDNTITILRRKH